MIYIYSTPTCSWCRRAKDYLKSMHIGFTDYDVSEDEEKAKEMIDKSGQMAVPVMDIEGTIVVGFDKDAIDAALEKHHLGRS